jgi:uncharacterized membrane protein YjfL (UPF0719 family)
MLSENELKWLGISFVTVVIGLIVLLMSKFIKDWLTPYRLDDQMTEKGNSAVGLATIGYFAGTVIIYLGATIGPDPSEVPSLRDLAIGWGIDLAYAVGGILVLNLSRVLLDRLVLRQFSMRKEIVDDRNVGAGAVEAGAMVASALVIAGAIHGEGSWLTAVAFYGLGQVVLVLFTLFYQWLTHYDLHAEIEKDNVAAGVAFGMNLVAIGLIMLKATSGDFAGWESNLIAFGLYAAAGFITFLVVRKLADWLLLPKTTFEREIAENRSLNAAWVEGVVALSAATLVLFIF